MVNRFRNLSITIKATILFSLTAMFFYWCFQGLPVFLPAMNCSRPLPPTRLQPSSALQARWMKILSEPAPVCSSLPPICSSTQRPTDRFKRCCSITMNYGCFLMPVYSCFHLRAKPAKKQFSAKADRCPRWQKRVFGGSIEVQSEVGQDTTFTVRLPVSGPGSREG